MSDTYVPTPWEDPMLDPWMRGLPTQQDIFANEYGQGVGDQDDVDDNLDWLKEYLKMHQAYIPDMIPGIPEWVDAPDTSVPVYESDFINSYRNDKAYNEVNRLVQSGIGIEEAIQSVLGMAEEEGWAMPMNLDTGDRILTINPATNEPYAQWTEASWKAEQERIAAGGGEDGTFADMAGGGGGAGPAGPVQLPPNVNETLFAQNSREFVSEYSLEQRSQRERDAAIAEYEDFHAPRFSFDVLGALEQGGNFAGRTNYSPAPPPGGFTPTAPGGFDQNYRSSDASQRRGPVAQGGFDPDYLTRGLASQNVPLPRRSRNGVPSSLGGTLNPHAELDSLPGRQSSVTARQGYQPYVESQQDKDMRIWRRDKAAADRTNAANAAAAEEYNRAYDQRIRERAVEEALPSKAQQHRSMIDRYLASVAYGGNQ